MNIPFADNIDNTLENDQRVILRALITAPGQIEITARYDFNPEVAVFELYRWNYTHTETDSTSELTWLENPVVVVKDNIAFIQISDWKDDVNYVLKYQDEWINAYLSPTIGGVLDTHFNAEEITDFGVRIENNTAIFKVWSPPATDIEILLFDTSQQPLKTDKRLWMQKGENGVFTIILSADILKIANSFDGLFYQYRVYAYGKSTTSVDPCCFSMASFNPGSEDKIGKSAIVDLLNPKATPVDFHKNYSNAQFVANQNDLVAYEIHIRDFTSEPNVVNSNIAGTFLGAIEKVNYLKYLGITHVQLLPVMNFYTVHENDRSFSNSKSKSPNYNWGYDTHHFFALEGWYSTNANDPYSRIFEFKKLVQSLHDQGVGVIMDVVFNHTYLLETFDNIAPGCYFRYFEDYSVSSHTGAGFTLESRRKMVRKLIIDSLTFFVTHYHIDGFRFDLMGFMDHETISLIREKVGTAYNPSDKNELFLQGEGWLFSDLDVSASASGVNAATTKINYSTIENDIGIFNDVARDSISGNLHEKGFINGDYSQIDKVASVIVGGLKGFNPGAVTYNNSTYRNPYHLFANNPHNCLNFLSVHDGFTLWDKINLHCYDVKGFYRARLMRFASSILFTSQGKIILHGGDELLRTKPLADFDKESHRAFSSKWINIEEDASQFHENSYASSDFTNMIRWSRMNNQYAPIARRMVDYYKGLILMRRAIPAFRLNHRKSVLDSLKFIPSSPDIKNYIPSVYSDFKDVNLKEFTIHFIHGPIQKRLFLVGEVHEKSIGVNPLNNPFFVDFDQNGTGKITFYPSQILHFNLGEWGDGISLNFKLVSTPGAWDFLQSAYTKSGNNVVMIQGVSAIGEALVDLAIQNHWVGITPVKEETWIAYSIDNLSENEIAKDIPRTDFKQIIVAHNASDVDAHIFIDLIDSPEDWSVILDTNNAGISKLTYSKNPTNGETDVIIGENKIVVPYKSSVVIAR